MARRKFDRNFKLAAVKLVVQDEMPVSEVAKQLDIHYNSLYRRFVNTKSMEKVCSLVMGAHFIIISMK